MSAFPYGAARLKTYMEDFFRLTNKVKVRVRCVDVLYALNHRLSSIPEQNPVMHSKGRSKAYKVNVTVSSLVSQTYSKCSVHLCLLKLFRLCNYDLLCWLGVTINYILSSCD